MAPLTRNRASISLAPTDIMTKYYTQRASAGELPRIVSTSDAIRVSDSVAGSNLLIVISAASELLQRCCQTRLYATFATHTS
jgi:2,4-dienoyl-CoA reductase-like NADH-dependent reductase (Old Yellow Enzyme family)